MVVGHHVDDPRCVPRRDQGAERVDVESTVVAREPDDRGARGPEGLDGAQVGRLLQRDLVAGGDHGAGQQVEALLGPRGDHDLVGVDAQSIGHHFPQRRQTGGRPVLQRDRAVGTADRCRMVGRGTDPLRVEQVEVGQAAGEGDDAGSFGQREQVPDGR